MPPPKWLEPKWLRTTFVDDDDDDDDDDDGGDGDAGGDDDDDDEGGGIRGAFLCCREAGRLRTLFGAMGAKVAEVCLFGH